MSISKKSIKLIFVSLISILLSFEASIGMAPKTKLWEDLKLNVSEKYLHEDKMRDAYHEAGHVLIAALNNVKIKSLTLIPTLLDKGKTSFIGISQIEHNIMIALGGYLAEEIIFGQSGRGCFEDLEQAISSAGYMAPGKYINPKKLTPMQIIKEFLETTRKMLLDNIKCLHALALAAEEEKTLSGDEIYAIVNKFATAKTH